MRKLHVFIFCMISLTIASRADTTGYVTSGCKEGLAKVSAGVAGLQDTLRKEIVFHDDTVTVKGLIYANCCGTHLLDINITTDKVIKITRIDTGMLCACHCPFEFIVNIPECEADSYSIQLKNYFNDSLDTMISRGAQTAINRSQTGPRYNVTHPHHIIGTGEALFDLQGRFLGQSLLRRAPGIYLIKSPDYRHGSIKFIHE